MTPEAEHTLKLKLEQALRDLYHAQPYDAETLREIVIDLVRALFHAMDGLP